MKQLFNKLNLSVSALIFVLFLSVSAPAMAHDTSSGGGSSNSASGSETEGPTHEVDHDKVNSLVQQFRDNASATKDQLRAKETEKLKQARVKVCDGRKTSINSRISRTENFASSHKEKLDAIYVKVKAFHDSKNLTVANYDQLVTAVDTAQADAAAKVAALKAVNTTVDCANQNVADGLSAYRAALSETRDSLKTYRSALLDLMKAVREAAKTAQPAAQSGSSQ
jgi:chromosome segregation ATPase